MEALRARATASSPAAASACTRACAISSPPPASASPKPSNARPGRLLARSALKMRSARSYPACARTSWFGTAAMKSSRFLWAASASTSTTSSDSLRRDEVDLAYDAARVVAYLWVAVLVELRQLWIVERTNAPQHIQHEHRDGAVVAVRHLHGETESALQRGACVIPFGAAFAEHVWTRREHQVGIEPARARDKFRVSLHGGDDAPQRIVIALRQLFQLAETRKKPGGYAQGNRDHGDAAAVDSDDEIFAPHAEQLGAGVQDRHLGRVAGR